MIIDDLKAVGWEFREKVRLSPITHKTVGTDEYFIFGGYVDLTLEIDDTLAIVRYVHPLDNILIITAYIPRSDKDWIKKSQEYATRILNCKL